MTSGITHRPPPRSTRWLYALPDRELPQSVTCRGRRYDHIETFKHDFFAATGLYRGPDGLAVLKLGRQTDFVSLPMTWLGALLARREARNYAQLQGVPGIPRLIGRVHETGLLHAFVPGHPLGRREAVSDSFFDELVGLLQEVHNRHIAYVDLNKRQNILMGDDGKPYLVDFQISLWFPPAGWRRFPPLRWLLRRFQQADRYHCLKHKRRLRPDLLSATELAHVEKLSIWIRLHRWLARPLTHLRRRTLKRLHASEKTAVRGSSAK
ncbi:MAG: hypothetical protein KKB50_04015 [Planctomycetes bacterium]|nr:hypothetical protein [Planctomycetota bacterium]